MADENQVKTQVAADNAQQDPAMEAAQKPTGGKSPGDPVKRWTRIILIICLALLAWYLRADRVTPFTAQARVHALVVPVAPEVSGTITGVFVSNNQVVEKGQELFQIDAERYQFAVQNAEAALQQAYQGLGAAGSNVDAARARLDSARANQDRTRLDTERMRRIRQQDPGAISQRRLESAEASLKVSEGQVVAAEAGLQAAIEQLGEPGDKNSAVQQAQAALDGARLDLERAMVRAPEAGVVTGVQLDIGNFAGAGQPQMTFIATHNIWIQADLKENNLGHISPGNEVGIIFDVLPGKILKGTVREIGFGVDVASPPLGKLPTIQNDKNWLRAAQRYPVLVDFELPVNMKGMTHLKVGSQATVVVYTGSYPVSNVLARMMMRIRSILTYAY